MIAEFMAEMTPRVSREHGERRTKVEGERRWQREECGSTGGRLIRKLDFSLINRLSCQSPSPDWSVSRLCSAPTALSLVDHPLG